MSEKWFVLVWAADYMIHERQSTPMTATWTWTIIWTRTNSQWRLEDIKLLNLASSLFVCKTDINQSKTIELNLRSSTCGTCTDGMCGGVAFVFVWTVNACEQVRVCVLQCLQHNRPKSASVHGVLRTIVVEYFVAWRRVSSINFTNSLSHVTRNVYTWHTSCSAWCDGQTARVIGKQKSQTIKWFPSLGLHFLLLPLVDWEMLVCLPRHSEVAKLPANRQQRTRPGCILEGADITVTFVAIVLCILRARALVSASNNFSFRERAKEKRAIKISNGTNVRRRPLSSRITFDWCQAVCENCMRSFITDASRHTIRDVSQNAMLPIIISLFSFPEHPVHVKIVKINMRIENAAQRYYSLEIHVKREREGEDAMLRTMTLHEMIVCYLPCETFSRSVYSFAFEACVLGFFLPLLLSHCFVDYNRLNWMLNGNASQVRNHQRSAFMPKKLKLSQLFVFGILFRYF